MLHPKLLSSLTSRRSSYTFQSQKICLLDATLGDKKYMRAYRTSWATCARFYRWNSSQQRPAQRVRAGCGVVTGPGFGFGWDEYQYHSFRLETSPSHNLTSNRAELRAAVAALVETDWNVEGIDIATDSEYVTMGATKHMQTWRDEITGEWRVKRENMDLWDRLMTAIEAWQSRGFLVMFYPIRRDWNRADRYAKEAANY